MCLLVSGKIEEDEALIYKALRNNNCIARHICIAQYWTTSTIHVDTDYTNCLMVAQRFHFQHLTTYE